MKSPGQIGYEAFVSQAAARETVDGRPYPTWERLPESWKARMEFAAAAVLAPAPKSAPVESEHTEG